MPNPRWVRESVQEARRKERTRLPSRPNADWTQEDERYESRVIAVVYPRDSYYVVDTLGPEGWERADPFGPKTQDTEERAISQAQSLANKSGQPTAVREILPL